MSDVSLAAVCPAPIITVHGMKGEIKQEEGGWEKREEGRREGQRVWRPEAGDISGPKVWNYSKIRWAEEGGWSVFQGDSSERPIFYHQDTEAEPWHRSHAL